MLNVVEEMPVFAQGEITEKPTPTPKARRTKVIASDATAPAKTILQLTMDCASSIAAVPVSVIMGPISSAHGMSSHALRLNSWREQRFKLWSCLPETQVLCKSEERCARARVVAST